LSLSVSESDSQPEGQQNHAGNGHSEKPGEGGPPHPAGRHTGKVARLPKTLRDQVNLMIQDGATYPAIIRSLGDAGKNLNVVNLTRWKKGGHQDWLLEQTWLADTRARQESASDLVRDFDATQVNHAALQLGTLHIFEAMRTLGPGSLDQKLGGDSAAFARLLNALARVSRETLQLQKYREACAKARTVLQPLRDPKRKLTDEERRALVLVVDDILGLPPQDDPPEDPSTEEEASATEDSSASPARTAESQG